jgi:sugar lactone lactonase YvrE
MATGSVATSNLEVALSLDAIASGVTTSLSGRLFLVFPRLDGLDGPRVAECVNGDFIPYPDGLWNEWTPNRSPAKAFVRANSARTACDGKLWIVDAGAPAFEEPIAGGPKLVSVDLSTDRTFRVYPLDDATTDGSFIDDVRFNGRRAYITDAGAPAIVVLDLDSGNAWRALDGHASVTAQKPMSAEGKELRGADGKPLYIHADQLEVSPETRWLDDVSIRDAERARYVEFVAPTPPTGGTAIAADGTIYASDVDRQRLYTVTPEGEMTVLIEDPRLLWVAAMWLDHARDLWMPVAPSNRIAPFQDGVSQAAFPMHVFKLQVGRQPAPSDHP